MTYFQRFYANSSIFYFFEEKDTAGLIRTVCDPYFFPPFFLPPLVRAPHDKTRVFDRDNNAHNGSHLRLCGSFIISKSYIKATTFHFLRGQLAGWGESKKKSQWKSSKFDCGSGVFFGWALKAGQKKRVWIF